MSEKLIDRGPVLLVLEEDGVARLRLNRPEASNGMDVPFLQALHAAILCCHAEPRVRTVLVTAAKRRRGRRRLRRSSLPRRGTSV